MTQPDTPSRPRVLFMDDEPDIRRIGQRVLNYLGYEAVLVANGEEALSTYAAARDAGQPFDAVILDLTIPGGMGGTETMQRLLSLDPAAKGIVSSGYSNDDAVCAHGAYGFVATVSKPYEIATLQAVLDRVLADSPDPA